jgi:hypothetical protein
MQVQSTQHVFEELFLGLFKLWRSITTAASG